MPKKQTTKQAAGKAVNKPKKAAAPAAKRKAKPSSTRTTVDKAVRTATTKARALAANPAVAEIVAASLVAAAAAIKNPKKARDMATAVGTELEKASKQSVDRGNAFWQLALDVAQRSLDALSGDKKPAKAKGPAKKKTKK